MKNSLKLYSDKLCAIYANNAFFAYGIIDSFDQNFISFRKYNLNGEFDGYCLKRNCNLSYKKSSKFLELLERNLESVESLSLIDVDNVLTKTIIENSIIELSLINENGIYHAFLQEKNGNALGCRLLDDYGAIVSYKTIHLEDIDYICFKSMEIKLLLRFIESDCLENKETNPNLCELYLETLDGFFVLEDAIDIDGYKCGKMYNQYGYYDGIGFFSKRVVTSVRKKTQYIKRFSRIFQHNESALPYSLKQVIAKTINENKYIEIAAKKWLYSYVVKPIKIDDNFLYFAKVTRNHKLGSTIKVKLDNIDLICFDTKTLKKYNSIQNL